MSIEIVNRDKTRIVGLTVDVLLKNTKEQLIIPKLQQSFNERVNEIEGAVGLPVTYGVFIDPPNYNQHTDLFTWIAGVEVEEGFEPQEDMISYEIPGGTYAVLPYSGNIDNAGSAYDQLYTWISASEYEQTGTYGFEMYMKIHSAHERNDTEMRLHFPIIKK
ncbi:MAG: GyrI-like domain-containing protein [Bacillota bacterium]